MNVKIYEEQTGLIIFPIVPGKEPDKDESIINFFNNGVDLYVEKKAKELRISCHVVVKSDQDKNKGYYIKSISKFEDDSFTEFKKESNKTLRALGFQHDIDDMNNMMLDNIEKLDIDIYCHEDTEIIAHVLESGEYLEYKAGNIDEITIFCKDILRKIVNSKIAISSRENTLGDINIFRTRKHEEPLLSNARTRQVLDKLRTDLIEKKRQEDENLARYKINDGTNLIKEGLTILRSTGYEPKDISKEIDSIYSEISTSNKIRLKEKLKPRDIDTDKNKNKIVDGYRDKENNSNNINMRRIEDGLGLEPNTIIVAAVIIVILLLLSSTFWGFPIDMGNNGKKSGQGITPVPVATLPPLKNVGNSLDINLKNGNNYFNSEIR